MRSALEVPPPAPKVGKFSDLLLYANQGWMDGRTGARGTLIILMT